MDKQYSNSLWIVFHFYIKLVFLYKKRVDGIIDREDCNTSTFGEIRAFILFIVYNYELYIKNNMNWLIIYAIIHSFVNKKTCRLRIKFTVDNFYLVYRRFTNLYFPYMLTFARWLSIIRANFLIGRNNIIDFILHNSSSVYIELVYIDFVYLSNFLIEIEKGGKDTQLLRNILLCNTWITICSRWETVKFTWYTVRYEIRIRSRIINQGLITG